MLLWFYFLHTVGKGIKYNNNVAVYGNGYCMIILSEVFATNFPNSRTEHDIDPSLGILDISK